MRIKLYHLVGVKIYAPIAAIGYGRSVESLPLARFFSAELLLTLLDAIHVECAGLCHLKQFVVLIDSVL